MARNNFKHVKFPEEAPMKEEDYEVLYTRNGEPLEESFLVESLLATHVHGVVNHDSKMQSFSRDVDLVMNIANVIRNDSKISTESSNEIIRNLYRMAGLNQDGKRTIATEAYIENNMVATEGFGSFLKKVWKSIMDFIKGFFKAVKDFFMVILGLEVPKGKKIVSIKEKIDRIRRLGLIINESEVKTIRTLLADFVNHPEPYNAKTYDVLQRVRNVNKNYREFIGDRVPKINKLIRDGLIPSLLATYGTLNTGVKTTGELKILEDQLVNMINAVNNVRKEFAGYSIGVEEWPDNLRDRIESRMSNNETEYSVHATFDPRKPDLFLARGLNFVSIQHKSLDYLSDIRNMDKDNMDFYYETYIKAKNEMEFADLDPIRDTNTLESMYREIKDLDKIVDMKRLSEDVARTDKAIVRALNIIGKNIDIKIENLNAALAYNEPHMLAVFSWLIQVHKIAPYKPGDTAFEVAATIPFLNAARDTTQNFDPGQGTANIKGAIRKDPRGFLHFLESRIADPANPAIAYLYQYEDEMVPIGDYIITRDMAPMPEPSPSISDEDLDEYAGFPDLIERAMRKSFSSVQRLIQLVGVDSAKTFVEYENILLDFISESADQYS